MKLLLLLPTTGTCDICGSETLLTHRDPPTALQTGRCCAAHLAFANHAVELGMMLGGPCHPQPGQFTSGGN